MSVNRKTEARLLDRAELDAVEPTHYPDICHLNIDELHSRRRLREYRDKARDRARQQRRDMRGRGEPRGVTTARG